MEKILNNDVDLHKFLEAHKGKKIVFTNGCFDILHTGHAAYLKVAKSLGDLLVIGVNTDQSVKSFKGDKRPIIPLYDRMFLLAALESVDAVISFNDRMPVRLIEKIKPQIYVKGGDYTRETLPEAEVVESYGGEVLIVPMVESYSTSNIINRICQVYGS